MEGKDSIILYVDTMGAIVSDLTDEQSGKLLKQIVSYVKDENPPEPDDLVVRMAWKIIRSQLKRDLMKWKERKQEKSKGGRMGNLKRWNSDLYLRVQSKDLTIDEAEKIASVRSQPNSEPIIKTLPDAEKKQVQLPDDDSQESEPTTENAELEKRIRKATKTISDFFGISEINQSASYLKIGRFVNYIARNNDIGYLSDQFLSYVEFKDKKGFKHSWESFTGTIENGYDDGAWNKENWNHKLKELKKTDGSEPGTYKRKTNVR